jgi:hypothetical protein
MPEIQPLSVDEKSLCSDLVVGKTTCPYCSAEDIKVVNDDGSKGDPESHYFENHYPQRDSRRKYLCDASGKMLSDFKP